MEDIQQFAQQVKDKLGLEEFDVVLDNHDNIELSSIRVPRDARKAGAGAAAMKALTDYADRAGRLIWLGVADRDSSTGTTSRSRLVKFYRQFGFIPNKGRNKRFELSMYAHMYRDPKGVKEEINDIRRRAGLPISEDQQQYPRTMSDDEVYEYIKGIHNNEEDIFDGDIYERVQAYKEYQLIEIPMEEVDRHQFAKSDEMIDEYAEMTKRNPNYPPIVYDTIGKSIIDGTHRANALHKLGAKTIRAYAGIPQSARSWEEINSLLGLDDYNEEINIIRRRAGLPMINETVEHAKLEVGKSIDLIVNPSKKDLDILMQYVIKKLDGRKPPDGSHVKGFYNPTMKTVWIWDGTAATHAEVGMYLITKYGQPETEDWTSVTGDSEEELEMEEEGGWIPMIIDRGDSGGYHWWVPNENVFNEPAIKRLEPVPHKPRIL